ncbi:MAG TPA: energy-coupling factor ABC transporter permease [Candidatus Acidoferrum sp.]|nr:energy-coupling factor ABC transporter permease [Candidatus Acidoferrum sp.]
MAQWFLLQCHPDSGGSPDMHVPDGFLDAKTAATTAALSAVGLGLALRRARLTLPPQKVPLLGLAAAFIFAAQMLNFPVMGGTSGHLIGATLAAVLLGPSAAVIAISCVLIVQCFLFADGGVTALGANIFNMALIGGVGGWAIYSMTRRIFPGRPGTIIAAFFASWCATVVGAIVCAGELVASQKAQWNVVFPAMTFVHMIIGVGEGLVTALVLSAVSTSRPDLIVDERPAERSLAPFILYGALIAIGLALFVSPFASSAPDGLDKTAQALGFADGSKILVHAPMSEYQIKGISFASLSTSIAGLIGTVVALGLGWLLARLLVPKPAARP